MSLKPEIPAVLKTIRAMIDGGTYDQNRIFNALYPRWSGHYSVLRDLISMEKNDDANRYA